MQGDVLDGERLRRSLEGATPFSISRRTPTCGTGSTIREWISSRTRSRPSLVLEAMRAAGVERIAFSSTGSVYGEPEVFPTPETCPFPVQTSLYGASKLAGEGLIQAYAHGYGFVGVIFRFVSILGERYTHGHVFDFCRSLREDPSRLRVLGNGRQEKSYLYVGDCVSAMTLATDHAARTGNGPRSTTSGRTRPSSSTTRSRRSLRTSASRPSSSTRAASAAGSATAR